MELIGILVFAAAVPFAFSLAVPRRLFPHLFGGVALSCVIWMLLPSSGLHDGSPGDFMAPLIGMAIGTGLAVGLLTKFTQFWVFERGTTGSSPTMAVIIGVLFSVVACLATAAALRGLRPTSLAHAVAAALIVAWILAPKFVAMRPTGDVRPFLGAAYWSGLVLAVAAIAYGMCGIDAVLRRAEAFAQDAPYCLQVATPGPGLAQATSLLDLSPLTMRATCGALCLENHAVLAMNGEVVANWSYRTFDFRTEPLVEPVSCGTRAHYVKSLPLVLFGQ